MQATEKIKSLQKENMYKMLILFFRQMQLVIFIFKLRYIEVAMSDKDMISKEKQRYCKVIGRWEHNIRNCES